MDMICQHGGEIRRTQNVSSAIGTVGVDAQLITTVAWAMCLLIEHVPRILPLAKKQAKWIWPRPSVISAAPAMSALNYRACSYTGGAEICTFQKPDSSAAPETTYYGSPDIARWAARFTQRWFLLHRLQLCTYE